MPRAFLIIAALAALAAGPALASEALAKARHCLACHSVDKKIVGPAYRDIAKKFADQPDAAATLSNAIVKGSQGTWGRVPMPPNAAVSPDEAKRLAAWVLSLK
ncbi:MAG: c-type cytochrome [Burkholderiaceae bacterium]|jgi:cytochrome c|nr:c-type cytochrome [Burkholderiaceae bacterium]